MPKVTFLPDNFDVDIEDGGTILEAAENFDIPLKHNCGGACNCGTCHVIIEEGGENISEMDPEEEDTLDRALEVTNESRLACQCRIKGDVVVTIPETSRS
jgi:ferredoxin, 2Fe-2S